MMMKQLFLLAGCISRSLPSIRGKARIGDYLYRLIVKGWNNDDYLVKIKMWDGSFMNLDLRSRIEQWAFWTGRYDYDIITCLSACLEPGSNVLDVGANVGFYSIPFGQHLKNIGGKVYAFEPVRRNYDRLSENILLNGLASTVQPFNVALGEKEGSIQMALDDKNGASTGNAVICDNNLDSSLKPNQIANVVPLDALFDAGKVDRCALIKVDIEGAEVLFLKGAIKYLSEYRPIIYGEFNKYWIQQLGYSFLDVVDITRPLGYLFFQQNHKGLFYPMLTPTTDAENILLLPSDASINVRTHLGIR